MSYFLTYFVSIETSDVCGIPWAGLRRTDSALDYFDELAQFFVKYLLLAILIFL